MNPAARPRALCTTRQRHLRGWQAALMVVALLLAQSLGLVHRIAHPASAGSAAPAHAEGGRSSSVAALPDGPGARLLALVVPWHAAVTDCAAYDQMCMGAAAPAPAPALAVHLAAATSHPLLLPPIRALRADQRHRFQARAPPATRRA